MYMAKPHVIVTRKVHKDKSGKKRVYETWQLRITRYDKDLGAAKPFRLTTLGKRPVMRESQAVSIVEEFGDEHGFTMDELRETRRLRIVPDDEIEDVLVKSGTTGGGGTAK